MFEMPESDAKTKGRINYPFDAVAFDQLKIDEFVPLLDAAIQEAKQLVANIKQTTARPTFLNTIVPLEAAAHSAYDVATIYGNLRIANGDPAMQALASEMMPRLIKLENDINLDSELFNRVNTAVAEMNKADFTSEKVTLAQKTLISMKRNGALLSLNDQKKLRALDDELSLLVPKFSQNVLNATNGFQLIITDRRDLDGIPQSFCDAAFAAAKGRNLQDSWVFTLHAPSALPFLKYSTHRGHRETLWRALNSRAFDGEYSNQENAKRIAKLRHDRARLLGYETFAHYQLEERMAENPTIVREFLQKLLQKSIAPAKHELAELVNFIHKKGCRDQLMPWDYAYWANKLKEEKYQYDVESTRPYFELQGVLSGAFEVAKRLYDIEFKKISNVPVYAPDVETYQVSSVSDGRYLGLFYTDFYSRSTKNPGAWCTRFRSQWIDDQGVEQRPHVSIVCNFAKPPASEPCLLNFQEVTTLFHEFGHALHGLLSRCQFRVLSCTNVYRDFVELPSQIMENWLTQPECLALFARHYLTGEPLPATLMTSIIESENFHAAYFMLRQLRFAYLDMAWFSNDPGSVDEIANFEAKAVAPTDLLPNVQGTNISCSFEHIFSGGYSAGYYGYKWAEVLDADAFESFKEKGIFSREVAGRFRRSILERGGTEHPMKLYREFRGRDPDPEALLRRSQLI